MLVTADQIAERMGIMTLADQIEMIEPAKMADVTRALDEALARKNGHPFFNPKGTRVKDLDMQYFIAHSAFANSGLQCLITHKSTGREMISCVELWPRNDFWVLMVELSRLA